MENYFFKKPLLSLVILFLAANSGFAGQVDKAISSKKIIEQAYKDAQWGNLSLEIRQVKLEPQKGFVPMKLNSPALCGQVYYVASDSEFNLKDIVALDVFYRPLMGARGTLGIKIYFKIYPATRLKDYSHKHIHGLLGVIINGKLRSIIEITEPITDNSLNLGEFHVKEALSILQQFYKPLEPMWQYFRWP
ncbi:MAG: hypothetical protein WC576_03030 [Candidatus Omnitrophota bacterium]